MTEDEGAYLGFTGHRLLACPGERPGGLWGLLQVTKTRKSRKISGWVHSGHNLQSQPAGSEEK